MHSSSQAASLSLSQPQQRHLRPSFSPPPPPVKVSDSGSGSMSIVSVLPSSPIVKQRGTEFLKFTGEDPPSPLATACTVQRTQKHLGIQGQRRRAAASVDRTARGAWNLGWGGHIFIIERSPCFANLQTTCFHFRLSLLHLMCRISLVLRSRRIPPWFNSASS